MTSCACNPTIISISGKSTCNISSDAISNQQRIHKQFGVHASQFISLLGAVTAHNPKGTYWHQASDRTTPKKGGVDIKHNSYLRYLAKRTGELYKIKNVSTNTIAKTGGKRRAVGIASLGPNGTC